MLKVVGIQQSRCLHTTYLYYTTTEHYLLHLYEIQNKMLKNA
jgi:hypothetical protein